MNRHVGLLFLALFMSAFSFDAPFSPLRIPLAESYSYYESSNRDQAAALNIASKNDYPGYHPGDLIAGDMTERGEAFDPPSENVLVVGLAPQQQATSAPTRTRTPIPPTPAPTKTRTPIPPTATRAPARTLVFGDEFEGGEWNRTHWLPCHWWATVHCTSQPMNELELYTASSISLSDGKLVLRGSKLSQPIEYCDRDCRRYTYASGMVQAGGGRWPDRPAGFTFTYGYIEVRAKIPLGKGLWPAIWLWPANYKDPPEIDIMEMNDDAPNKVFMTYHHPDSAVSTGTWVGPDFSQGYHTFAIDWLPNALVWYIDGVERYRWTGATPSQPMYPILNLAIGGDGPGAPDASTVFPADFLIDYIRIFKNSPGS